MPDVPPSGADRKPLVTVVQPRSRPTRPSSPCCGARSWWNGWRLVSPVVARLVDGVKERWEVWLARAKCAACHHGFTCYPPGHYPRREYQLDVVAEVAAAVALGHQSGVAAAAPATASPTSAWRWTRWVAALASPAELYALATELDPDAPAGAGVAALPAATPARSAAAEVLTALELVGAALPRVRLGLPARSGLGRLLTWQHEAHGVALRLRDGLGGLSPAMAREPRARGP